LVSFNDQNGQLCYASLGVKAGSPIYEQCAAYVKDASQQIGSLVLSGCFKLNTMESQMDQMEREYKNTCEQAKQYFGYTAEETSFHLNYEDATKEGYLEQNSNNALIGVCITGSFAVLFAVLLFFILRQRKKIKAAEQMVAGQFQQGFGVDIQNYPPAPQNPTDPQNPVEPQNTNYPQSFQ